MDAQLLLVCAYFGTMFAIVLGFVLLRKRLVDGGGGGAHEEEPGEAGSRGRRQRGMQRMRAQARAAGNAAAGHLDDGDDDEREMTRREERAEARRQQREADEQRAEAKKQKAVKYEEKLRARQQEREEKQAELDRAAERKRQDELKQVENEYQQWKDLICVEEEGSADANVDQDGLLQRFVETIKRQKVVFLEDLAAEFGLPDAEAVLDRISELETQGLLSGIVDDRGKFIYITKEEMQGVVDFISQRGRVSIADVVAHSNRLIDLDGHDEHLLDISFDVTPEAEFTATPVVN